MCLFAAILVKKKVNLTINLQIFSFRRDSIRIHKLLDEHHDVGSLRPVGERPPLLCLGWFGSVSGDPGSSSPEPIILAFEMIGLLV